MLDLSPTKLLIIFVVVVVLLGPKRLPEVARQLGAGWRKVRELHLRLDNELRQVAPDLPSSQDIVRFARSPVTLLNQLADVHGASPSQEADVHGASPSQEADVHGSLPSQDADVHGSLPSQEADVHAESVPHTRAAVTSPTANGTGAPEETRAHAARPVPPALRSLDTDDPNLN